MDPSPYDMPVDEAAPSDYQRRLEEQRLRNKDPIAAAATPLGASRKQLAETPDALPKKVTTKRRKKSDWARNKPKKELDSRKRQREKAEEKKLIEARRAREGLHISDEMDEDEAAVDDTVTFAPGTVETEEPSPKKPKVADVPKREATPEPEPAEPEMPEPERAESEPEPERAESEPAEPEEAAEPEPADSERQAPEEADAPEPESGSAPCGLADLLLADADGHGDAPPAPAPEALEASPKWPKVQPASSPSAAPAPAAVPAEPSVPAPTLEPALEDVVKLPACRDALREDERACYDALMQWAQDAAAEHGVPAKQIMAPRTAAETVRLMPEKDDLLQAWGMSPKRIKQHGDAIMRVLEPFRTALRSR